MNSDLFKEDQRERQKVSDVATDMNPTPPRAARQQSQVKVFGSPRPAEPVTPARPISIVSPLPKAAISPPPVYRPAPSIRPTTPPVYSPKAIAPTAQRKLAGSSAPPVYRPTAINAGRLVRGFAPVLQRMRRDTVSLDATFGSVDLGQFMSQQTAYSEGTEHAEDALCDTIEMIEWEAHAQDMTVDMSKMIIIKNLTASPCSTTYGTCNKPDSVGCAERLVEKAREGYKIEVHADHFYQPKGVANAKQKSRDACEWMRSEGIKVVVAKK